MEGQTTRGAARSRRTASAVTALAVLTGLVVLLGPALPQLVTSSRHHAGAHAVLVVKAAVTTSEHAVTSYRIDDAPVVVTASLALLLGLVGLAVVRRGARTRDRAVVAGRSRAPPAFALR